VSVLGSFVTENICCAACAAAVREVLFSATAEKFFVPVTHPQYPIIAGRVGGLYFGEEKFVFDHELRDEIEERICHPVRIAVLCEAAQDDAILVFSPKGLS
jgi:hypothetical protein